jgi:hypothetical protein
MEYIAFLRVQVHRDLKHPWVADDVRVGRMELAERNIRYTTNFYLDSIMSELYTIGIPLVLGGIIFGVKMAARYASGGSGYMSRHHGGYAGGVRRTLRKHRTRRNGTRRA